MGSSPNENEVSDLVKSLSKLSQVYIQAPIQKEKYDGILTELRNIYGYNKEFFPKDRIELIKDLKDEMEQELHPVIEQRTSLLNFFPPESYIEAKSYAKKRIGLPLRTVVFHETEFFIGVVVDRNAVYGTYKLLFITKGYEWYKLDNLVVVGTCSKIWVAMRETHCWECHGFLGTGDKKCKRCGWYLCPDCKACNCLWLSGTENFFESHDRRPRWAK